MKGWSTEIVSIPRLNPPQAMVILIGPHLICNKIILWSPLPVLNIDVPSIRLKIVRVIFIHKIYGSRIFSKEEEEASAREEKELIEAKGHLLLLIIPSLSIILSI